MECEHPGPSSHRPSSDFRQMFQGLTEPSCPMWLMDDTVPLC